MESAEYIIIFNDVSEKKLKEIVFDSYLPTDIRKEIRSCYSKEEKKISIHVTINFTHGTLNECLTNLINETRKVNEMIYLQTKYNLDYTIDSD
jgi:hypothetical protein